MGLTFIINITKGFFQKIRLKPQFIQSNFKSAYTDRCFEREDFMKQSLRLYERIEVEKNLLHSRGKSLRNLILLSNLDFMRYQNIFYVSILDNSQKIFSHGCMGAFYEIFLKELNRISEKKKA